jgi:tRNA dimethylallyltransferase
MVALVSAGMPLLIVVLGATASGKSALAMELVERGVRTGGEVRRGEIVSCDSVAVYREMEIGTAKPSREERTRVPHHMIDVASPSEVYTAGDYSRAARAAIREISARGLVPIVAGGTGLYLRALLEGLFVGPVRDDGLRERLRAAAEKRGAKYVHSLLQKMDAGAAARIHENDLPKVVRAIEVRMKTRQRVDEAWAGGRDALEGFRVVRVGLDPARDELNARIDARAREMFANGLVEETRGLMAKYGEECRALGALGYKQAAAMVRGEMTEAEAIAATAQGHRNYAKRQRTWFRGERDVLWVKGFGGDGEVVRAVREIVES